MMHASKAKTGSLGVAEKKEKFVIYRDMEGGYRWRLRSATGETLAASEAGHPNKSVCEADMRAFMADHNGAAAIPADHLLLESGWFGVAASLALVKQDGAPGSEAPSLLRSCKRFENPSWWPRGRLTPADPTWFLAQRADGRPRETRRSRDPPGLYPPCTAPCP